MEQAGYALFETAIGVCGIAWGARGLVSVALPHGALEATRAYLLRRNPACPEAAPRGGARDAVVSIKALASAGRADFSQIALDMDQIEAFDRSVYDVARAIAAGATLTYGEIAARLGDRSLARAVGGALGRNPWPLIVPCHRVTAANGALGGFSAYGGRAAKLRLLAIERAAAADADLPLFAAAAGLQ
jgi:methylated-DNA-[protein]-cysteine S-methyltransferase